MDLLSILVSTFIIIALTYFSYKIFPYVYKFRLLRSSKKKVHELSRRSNESEKTYDLISPTGVFPSGWYKLCSTTDLGVGEKVHINALGTDFVVYRGTDGKPYVVYAYCPHLGANLCDGEVSDNCIKCPFHRWSFDGATGKCVDIPYGGIQTIPEQANTKTWPAKEYDDMICIYFDNSGLSVPPPYPLELVGSKGDMIHGGTKTYDLKMHIQEWVENSADYAHFDIVHGQLMFPIVNKLFFATFEIDTDYQENLADFKLKTYIRKTWDPTKPVQEAYTNLKILGPGGISYWWFYTPLGRVLIIKSVLPYDKLGMKMENAWYYDQTVPYWLVLYIVVQAEYAFNEDVKLWEKKVYLKNPVLVKGDGPIGKYRRWYSKYYKNSLEW